MVQLTIREGISTCQSDCRSALSVVVPIPTHATCVQSVDTMSHSYATADSGCNHESVPKSPDPFPREKLGLGTRLEYTTEVHVSPP